jgi:thiamine pyrophosphate-dependent acetolactate synthase large subunit-like protein
MSPAPSTLLNRRAATARILRDRGDALVVAGLGNPTFDVAAAGDTPLNFYLWGAMGGAAMLGLGLALAQPRRRILVFTGDGEMMMGLGSLATVSVEQPDNLAIIVLDNEHYGETGMQPGHTGRGVNLAGIALAAGFVDAVTIRTEEELEARTPKLLAARGPLFTVIKVSTDPAPTALPPRDGPYLRSRFREAVLGADAHR